MVKKGLVMTLVAYFFIIQAFIAWAIWQDSHFYTLGCINLIFFILFFFWISAFKGDWDKKQEKGINYPIVKEKIEQERVVSEPVVAQSVAEEPAAVEESESFRRVRTERPISESNIEYIKTKINRAKRKPLREWSPVYRFLVFLIAVFWLWGILYAFWDSLDFIALTIWALAMLIFIGVCFKSANLWRKSLFSSIYFLLFFLVLLIGVYWMIFSADKLKESISTFFDGVKGDEVVMSGNNQENEEDTGFLFEATGSVINFSLSWESIYSTWETLTGEQIVPEVTNTPTAETTNTEVSEQKVEQPVQAVKEEKTETTTANNPTSQVTIIEAIKHLVKAYNIPLSKSTSSKFTHVSKSSSMYPYMKTALEKRMIWTTTDPNMIVSCDVYMVMKWIAEWWNIAKSENLKENYWNVAESKWLLNWCTKWSKLTYVNL